MTVHNQGGPCLELERSLPSKVAAISPFVDRLMLLFGKCGCVSEGESEVEIALREALTVLVDERADGVHLSYDRMASFLAPYRNRDALEVARNLDKKIEDLLRQAAA
jgi:hypothetical protein